jgi:hypothetical protein
LCYTPINQSIILLLLIINNKVNLPFFVRFMQMAAVVKTQLFTQEDDSF